MKNYLSKASELKISKSHISDLKISWDWILSLKISRNTLYQISLEDVSKALIVILIFMTPIFSISEIVDLLLARVKSRSVNSTPGYIKALKDLGFVIIITVSFLRILRKGTYRKEYLFGLTVLILAVFSSLLLTILLGDTPKPMIAVIMGIRWLIPFIAIFFIYEIVDARLLNRIARALMISFFVHLGLQLIQLMFMGGYYGLNSFGLAARVPGFFLIPSTASFFSVLVIFFYLYFRSTSSARKNLFIFLTGLSVVITQSGSGFIVFFMVICLYYVPQKFLRISVLSAPLFGILLLGVFAITASRGNGYVEESGGTRVEILADVLLDTGPISSNFGVGTNAARILKTGKLMDSQIASIVYNLGLIFSTFIAIFLIMWLVVIFIRNNKMLYSFTAIYLLFGAAAIFSEAFPMNLLFAVFTAYLINQKKIGSVANSQT